MLFKTRRIGVASGISRLTRRDLKAAGAVVASATARAIECTARE